MTDLEVPTARALAIASAYDRLNLRQRGRVWITEELALGLVGDIGDLAKLVMADTGTRDIPGHREQLGTSSRTASGLCSSSPRAAV